MAFKHYDVNRAVSPPTLRMRCSKFVKDGNHTAARFLRTRMMQQHFIQAIVAEGNVTTPVVVKPSDGEGAVISTTSNPEYYFCCCSYFGQSTVWAR